MDDDKRETEQLVAAIYHHERGKGKKKVAAKDRGSGVLHHRANTDWWNAIKR